MTLATLLTALLLPSIVNADESTEKMTDLNYGTSGADFNDVLEKQTKRKLAMVDITAYYVTPRQIHFAAIWEKWDSMPLQVRVGLSRDAIKEAVTKFGGTGYRLMHLSATGGGGTERYSAIWKRIPGQQLVIRYGFPKKELMEEHKKQTENKFVIHRVMAVQVDKQIHFTAVWDNNGIGQRDLEVAVSESRFKRELKKRTEDGFRLRQLFVYVDKRRVRYACIWEKADGPQQEVVLKMTTRTLEKTKEEMKAKGFQLKKIQGYGLSRRDRFVGIWEKAK